MKTADFLKVHIITSEIFLPKYFKYAILEGPLEGYLGTEG